MKTKDNSTFPSPQQRDANGLASEMTLRDYFAAKALQGLWTGFQTRGLPISPDMRKQIAGDMYSMADAMVEARKS